MNENFIHLNVTQDIGHGVTVMFICAIAIVIFSLLDMSTAIRASRITKRGIESNKLRRTINKILDYYHFLVAGIVLDITGLTFSFYSIPYAAVLVTLAVACIELKSMYENFKLAKSAAADVLHMVQKIMDTRGREEAVKLFKEIREYDTKITKRTEE